MDQSVGPWATQARIAQLIDENMHDLHTDPSVTEKLTFLKPHLLRSPDEKNPQIAPGESELLAPSRSRGRAEGTTSVIHRGDLEIEMIHEAPYVRVYVSLWAEARADKTGKVKYKDVHQSQDTGEITIHTGRDQGEQREGEEEDEKMPIMWISGGQPLRQLKWFYKYPREKYNPGAMPVVRSFLVPLEIWNKISATAVNEEVARRPENKDKPFNVDTAYGANQFGLRGPMLELLRQNVISGTLVSYVGNREHSQEAYGGTIRHIHELREKLGAPRGPEPLPVWVDPKVGKFVRTGKQGSIADDLMFYYAVWTGNDNFLPEKRRKIPKPRRHEMLREFLKSQGRPLPKDYVLP
jgi:hypothetical protein